MDGFKVQDIMVSGNSKTGLSINVDQCSPTKWCYQHCYRRWRTVEMIARYGWNTTPNTGPVTWRVQAAAYKRNEKAIQRAAVEGRLDEITAKMVERIRARGHDTLRGNGTGDLFPELCEMYARFAAHGLDLFLFSRRPKMVLYLLALCDAMDVPTEKRPFVMGSVDRDTTPEEWTALISATEKMNGKPALAYSTDTPGEAGRAEVDAHPAREHFVVVFGYHSNQTKTVLEHELECPATAGGKIKCDACRRCYGR
jgi:hypothetical protein